MAEAGQEGTLLIASMIYIQLVNVPSVPSKISEHALQLIFRPPLIPSPHLFAVLKIGCIALLRCA